MASLVYDNFLDVLVKAGINVSSDTYMAMLVTSSYTPSKGSDQYRSTPTTNETSGTGYTAGGKQTTVSVLKDTTNNREDLSFSSVSWSNATISASACVLYKSVGSAATDVLLAYVDFGQTVSSTNAAFAVTFSSPLRFQN